MINAALWTVCSLTDNDLCAHKPSGYNTTTQTCNPYPWSCNTSWVLGNSHNIKTNVNSRSVTLWHHLHLYKWSFLRDKQNTRSCWLFHHLLQCEGHVRRNIPCVECMQDSVCLHQHPASFPLFAMKPAPVDKHNETTNIKFSSFKILKRPFSVAFAWLFPWISSRFIGHANTFRCKYPQRGWKKNSWIKKKNSLFVHYTTQIFHLQDMHLAVICSTIKKTIMCIKLFIHAKEMKITKIF